MSHEYKTNYQTILTEDQRIKLRTMIENGVPQHRIDSINAMLQDTAINFAWHDYQSLPQYQGKGKELLHARRFAWLRYTNARNQYLKQ